MKSCEEMVESLLSRRETYIQEQRRKRGTAVKTAAAALCIIAAAGLVIWRSGLNKTTKQPAVENSAVVIDKQDNNKEDDSSNIGQPVSTDLASVVYGDQVSIEGFTTWGNKTLVGYQLYEALKSGNDDDIYAIIIMPGINRDYVFAGKTLEEYESEMNEERNLPEKLLGLKKLGDSLKYGTALYETGTPDGEKWTRSLYEETVREFGEGFLNKYIVDGQFLKDKVDQDIQTAMTQTAASDAFKKAKLSYLNDLAASIKGSFPSEVSSSGNGIIVYMTKARFEAFEMAGSADWTFDLAVRGNGLDNEGYVVTE